MEILIGVVVIAGFTVLLFRRSGGYKDEIEDYSYLEPETGTWGCGQQSVQEVIEAAEIGIEATTEV